MSERMRFVLEVTRGERRSRAPHEHPNAVPLQTKAMLLEVRQQHPSVTHVPG